MDTQVAFFDRDEKFQFFRDDAYMLIHHEDEYYLEAAFFLDAEKQIESGMYAAMRDLDGEYQLFIVQQPTTDVVNGTIQFVAELAAMIELRDEDIIKDQRPTNVQAGMAVASAIEKTDWKLGTVCSTAIKSLNFYYESPWECLQKVAETYGCYFCFRVGISDEGISSRHVDVLAQMGRGQTGMRLEIDKNTDSLICQIDESDVSTALYGRGKGEEVGTSESGDPTYGRRITFADVVWSKANGDPCDKPAGQEYVEDVDATVKYGRKGRRRYAVVTFADCEDPSELLRLTWDELQARKAPKVTLKLTIKDLEDIFGYKDESIRLGDYVVVILDEKTEVVAQIASVTRDRLQPENTKLVIGSEVASITALQAATQSSLNRYQDMLDISSKLAARNPDLLNGILNTMVTQILSTGTKMYTDTSDGSLVFESDDGGAAVRLTGRGILIANEKDGEKWKWTTAIDGNGVVASVISSGVLNAALVRILGTDAFYWDAQAIFIFDTEDETKNRQIRIGCYDGQHYGIGFTRDGGKTWNTAIGFDGLNVNFSGAIEEAVNAATQATDDKLKSYSTTEQMNSALEQTAKGFTQTVEQTVTTLKEYADGAASDAAYAATQATDDKLKSYSTTEQMNSVIKQNAEAWIAQFQRIGLADGQTGITKVDENGVTVTHSNIGGQTQMNADGFRIYDAQGRCVGGLIQVAGAVIAAMQALYNVDAPWFRALVGRQTAVGLEGWGIELLLNGQVAGNIGAYTEEEYENAPPAGVALQSNKDLALDAGNRLRVLTRGDMDFQSTDGGLSFSFKGVDAAGYPAWHTITAQQLWELLARSGGLDD